MPKLATVRYLRQRAFGFEYFRAVPQDIVGIVGRQRWYARIHATSREDAARQVRALASQHDDLIVRARRDPEAFKTAQAALTYYDATPETIGEASATLEAGMSDYRARLLRHLEDEADRQGMRAKDAVAAIRLGEQVFDEGDREAGGRREAALGHKLINGIPGSGVF